MTIQLLSISSVYVVFNVPCTVLVFAFQYGLSAEIAHVPLLYTGYLYYYVIFVFPFVCCGSFAASAERNHTTAVRPMDETSKKFTVYFSSILL